MGQEQFELKFEVLPRQPALPAGRRSISLRIPEYILNRLKEKANEINVPYQSLIKGYIKEGLFAPAKV